MSTSLSTTIAAAVGRGCGGLLVFLAGCAGGLPGAPSVVESPALAGDIAMQKAREAAARESTGAQCFGKAVLEDTVERVPLATGSASKAAATLMASVEEARWLVGRADSTLVPIYCMVAEPLAVKPAKTAEAKVLDVARWYATRAVAVAPGQVSATVRAYGESNFRNVKIHDTGFKREVLLNRYGAYTNSPSEAARGGSRRLESVVDYTVTPVESARSVDVPGLYAEAWILVQVPRDKARRYRLACLATPESADRASSPTAQTFEAARTCSLYRPASTEPVERPAVVSLNPEEPF